MDQFAYSRSGVPRWKGYRLTTLDGQGVSIKVLDLLLESIETDTTEIRTAASHVLGVGVLIAFSSFLEHCIYASFLQSFLVRISV